MAKRRKRRGPMLATVVSVLVFVSLVGLTAFIIYLPDIFSNKDDGAAVFAETTPPPNGQTNGRAAAGERVGGGLDVAPGSLGPEGDDAPDFVINERPAPPTDATVYDYVIRNARYVNPETGSDIEGVNIGITGSTVAAVTRRPLNGNNVIDAAGLVAAPGFIDIDSYEPNPLGVKYKIADGVTTNLLMHGGSTVTATWYNTYERYTPVMNYGASNFITQIRAQIGYGINTPMTSESDINRLCELVERNIQSGALGISMSPEYAPGVQGEEMRRLCELAARYNLCTYYHLRYSTHLGEDNSIKGIREVIELARLTGCATHILHITSTGSTYCAEEAFAVVEEAQASGIDLTCDIYPYDSWATYLGSNRFSSGWQERFGLTYSDLQIANTNIRVTAETYPAYRAENRLVIANGSIPENEVRYALTKPYLFIASDTIIEPSLDDHPRGSGAYSRLIGHYGRELGILTLTEAVAKASYLPAKRLESASPDMKKKGRIEIGADADIVLFDYDTIIDKATNENVAVYSEGIEYVFINGVLVYQDGVVSSTPAGKPVMNYLVHPEEPRPSREAKLYIRGEAVSLLSYEIGGEWFIPLSDAAAALGVTYENRPDGAQSFGRAALSVGLTEYESYGQASHLLHEPVICRGAVCVREEDFPNLLYGLTFQ